MSEAAVPEPPGDAADGVPRTKSCSDMSVQDFLDFLHSSYMLNQTVETGQLGGGGRTAHHINWQQLMDTPTVHTVPNRDAVENATFRFLF